MNTEKMLRLQRALKDCKTVYAVQIRCDGEESVDAIWETKAAAEIHRDSYNGMKGNGAGYYGRARVASHRLQNEAMAREMFGTAARTIPE